MPAGPLDGVTILDLTRVLSGPYCTMLLADMGARVIKIERPGGGDDTRAWGPPFVGGESTYFLSINRNKESVTLDFKTREGREILDRIVAKADVFVENFCPGTLDRLGLGYETIHQTHPRLVYTSISGFGQTGPRREQAGYDAMIQAEGGLMSLIGDENGPPFRVGVAIVDLVAGLFAVQGTLLALYARERSSRGQWVDVSMFDGLISLLSYQASRYLNASDTPHRLGNRHPSIAPYDTFPTADGDFFLAVGNDDQFRRLCDVAGLGALAADSRFATNAARATHHAELRDLLMGSLRQRSRADWIAQLTAAGVPCGDVRDVSQALADPQVHARAMIEAVEHAAAGVVKLLGVPVKMSETPGTIRTPPPRLGEHTESVLREFGVTADCMTTLRAHEVI